MGDFNSLQSRSLRNSYEEKYKKSRNALLLVILFSFINICLLIVNADIYFLFSAFIPYFLTSFGMLICGRFPDEYYQGELAGMKFLDDYVFVILLIISIVLTLLYLLAWFKSSKNRGGWLIFALIFFSIDTSAMLITNGIRIDYIFDIIFHGWIIYFLIVGVNSYMNLKKIPLPSNETSSVDNNLVLNIDSSSPQILRIAETDIKYRVLLEMNIHGCDICYRRVKRTNELVINGYVYAQYVAMVEKPHTLSARIDGHSIEVGYNGIHSFIRFDYREVKKKLRIY